MNVRHRLCLWHNGTRGDVLFCRAVHRALLATDRFDLVLAVCRGDEDLLADLAGPHCRIVAASLRNTPQGAPLDLGCLCPADCLPLPVWLGGNGNTPNYQWPDIVDALHADLQKLGVHETVAAADGPVPMLDFAGARPRPFLRRAGVFLEASRTRHDSCHFVYDVPRLARVLPDHDLWCTAPPAIPIENVRDAAQLTWAERSRLSEACVALVGTTREPFAVTLTEANRWKPRALCGHDARIEAPFWDYPGNPMELLATMDELVDFLLANVAEGAPR